MRTNNVLMAALLISCASVQSKPQENHRAGVEYLRCLETAEADLCPAPFLSDDLVQLIQEKKALDACSQGHEDACSLAVELVGPRCESGEVHLCEKLSWGLFVSGMSEQGVHYSSRGCEGACLGCCVHFAFALERGLGVERDASRAAALYDDLCKEGDAMACNNLGVLYRLGDGVEQDNVRAFDLYLRACNLGDVFSCVNVGQRLLSGLGIKRDIAFGLKILNQACREGEAQGCYELGLAYSAQEAVEPDFEKAEASFEAACSLGEGRGCTRLAFLLSRSPDPDSSRIERLFERALPLLETVCKRENSAPDCHELSILYRRGNGVEKDLNHADSLRDLACDVDSRYCL